MINIKPSIAKIINNSLQSFPNNIQTINHSNHFKIESSLWKFTVMSVHVTAILLPDYYCKTWNVFAYF